MNEDYTMTQTPRSLVKAASEKEFPEWAGEIPAREDLSKLAPQAFGDMGNRLFPIHTKSAAFYSMIDATSKLDDVSEDTFVRLDNACKSYGIEDDVAPHVELFTNTFDKSASEVQVVESPFAIDTHIGREKFQLLPLGDPLLIQQAAEDLNKMATSDRAPISVIQEAAGNIVKAASIHGGDISGMSDQLRGWSEERFPDYDQASRLIQSRKPFTNKDDSFAMAEYESLIKKASTGEISPAECIHGIELVDASLGVKYNYHDMHGVMTPHEVVYSGDAVAEVTKQASQTVMINDVLLPLSVVQGLPEDNLNFCLSKEASEALKGYQDMDGFELTTIFNNLDKETNKEVLIVASEHGS